MQKTVLKTSLGHLPVRFQRDLEAIKQIILTYLPAEMIILFGSYARGNYVEDVYEEDGTIYEYISDYDILVVTEKTLPRDRWWKVERKVSERPTPIPSTLIDHTITFLNEKIRYNYYFFVDITKEGIMLYDSGKYELAVPEDLTSKQRLEKAQEYFEYWMQKADEFYESFEFNVQKEYYNTAAFLLHQAAENYYNTFSLVFTDYKPKTHDLEALRKRAINVNEAQRRVFPKRTKEEKRLFELLRKAYVDARYKRDYKITSEELQYLSERVVLLRELTEQLCLADLERLKGLVG